MTSFTFTPSVPAGTTMRPSTPSSAASTSMVALSVSISAITSPELTLSPSFFSHLARVPSVMVGDNAGIRMLIGISIYPLGRQSRVVARVMRARQRAASSSSAIGDLLRRLDDELRLRQSELLEVGGVGQRHVGAMHADHRRVEPVEGLLHHHRAELGADAGERPALLDADQA